MKISELQKDLAAAFRWTARLNMHEGIANHFSVCLPNSENFYVNGSGMHFSSIKASDLILVEKNKIEEIKIIYVKKIKNIVVSLNKSAKDSHLIFRKVKQDKIFLKFLEKKRSVDDYWNPVFPINGLESDFTELLKKTEYDYLSNYNFNAKTTKEQADNYPLYTRIYDDIVELNSLKHSLNDLSEAFKEEFNKNFAIYYLLLDNFAELNNFKNYLILLSILFQIIGLVGLMVLFRILIIENK